MEITKSGARKPMASGEMYMVGTGEPVTNFIYSCATDDDSRKYVAVRMEPDEAKRAAVWTARLVTRHAGDYDRQDSRTDAQCLRDLADMIEGSK